MTAFLFILTIMLGCFVLAGGIAKGMEYVETKLKSWQDDDTFPRKPYI